MSAKKEDELMLFRILDDYMVKHIFNKSKDNLLIEYQTLSLDKLFFTIKIIDGDKIYSICDCYHSTRCFFVKNGKLAYFNEEQTPQSDTFYKIKLIKYYFDFLLDKNKTLCICVCIEDFEISNVKLYEKINPQDIHKVNSIKQMIEVFLTELKKTVLYILKF